MVEIARILEKSKRQGPSASLRSLDNTPYERLTNIALLLQLSDENSVWNARRKSGPVMRARTNNPGYRRCERPIGPAKFLLLPGYALVLGAVNDTSLHAHNALQLNVALDGSFILDTPTETLECHSASIAPNQPHLFRGKTDRQMIALLDAQGVLAQRIRSLMRDSSIVTDFDATPLHPLIRDLLECATPPDCAKAKELSRLMLSALGRESTSAPLDSRIEAALDFVRRQPELKVSLGLVAETVGLSEGRLGHLFSEQVGIPLRRYLLWMRLVRSVDALVAGASLTTAAHASGFADSAHFTRTFRRMFGITPSRLFKNSRFVQVFTCPQ